jgi:pyruvate/2-oxoglutarate dehydrogenase complex dihydrolipoamide dehydrogenase (E3) component
MQRFDAIIVGAGQAGPPLAARLSSAGQTVALIERHLFGGTCVNTGCIPTKTLTASAKVAEMARRAAEYGIDIPAPLRVDMVRVKARKDRISGASREGVERWLRDLPNCAVFKGHARFETPHRLIVGDEPIEGERIFLNVGGRAVVPDLPGTHDVPYLTNTSILQLDTIPRHLVVIGGSYVGLEFAQMYRRFGAQVTVVERRPRLIDREDPDVSDCVREILEAEGITVRTVAECIRFRRQGEDVVVGVDCSSGAPEVVASHVLLAVGRRPNTDDLGLNYAGVETDARGFITVNDELRTNVSHIWAMGDCNGRGAFTHTSYNDFEIVAANLLDHDPRRVTDRITAYALYIDPPLGRAGMTDEQVRRSARRALTGFRPMTRVGRAVEKGETQGFMKVTVDANTQEILGAAIIGPGADEAIHCILDVMYAKAPYQTLQRAVHIHPTVSELIPTILGGLKPLT